MASVITLTLSPCIDKSVEVEEIMPERKMRCSSPQAEPGGGGINIARGIRRLGGEAAAIYFSGGYTGSALESLLQLEEIAGLPIRTRQDTRENWMVFERKTQKQFRFITPGPGIAAEEIGELLAAIRSLPAPDYLVLSGGLPAGFPTDSVRKIAAIAREKKARFIADLSGDGLLEALKAGVFLIKPNIHELETLAKGLGLTGKSLSENLSDLISRNYAEAIVVSRGAEGATLAVKGSITDIPAPKVKSLSTVGAGDSMVAGIIHSLISGKNLLEAVRFGVACGSAATLNPGTALFSPPDARSLYEAMEK